MNKRQVSIAAVFSVVIVSTGCAPVDGRDNPDVVIDGFGHNPFAAPGMPQVVGGGVRYEEQGHAIHVFPARPVVGDTLTVVVGKTEEGFPFAATSTMVMTSDGWASHIEIASVGCFNDNAALCLEDRGSFHYPKFLVFTLGAFTQGTNIEFAMRNGDSGIWLNNQGHNYRAIVEGIGSVTWVGDVRAYVGANQILPVDGGELADGDLTIMAQSYPMQGGVRVMLRYVRDAEPPTELEFLWDKDNTGSTGNNTDWYVVLPAAVVAGTTRLGFSVVATTQISQQVDDRGGPGYWLARPTATPVTLVAAGEHSYYGTDFNASYPYKVIYGFSSADALEFARTEDKSSLPWFSDPACAVSGHFTADISYTGENYTLYSNAVTVPAYGKGVLYRLAYMCRSNASGQLVEQPCGESEVRYKALSLPWSVGWAGSFDWVTFHRPPDKHWGDVNPATMCLCAPGSELSYDLRAEVWVPGVTDQNYPNGGEAVAAAAIIEVGALSDLPSRTPGGVHSYTPLTFMGRVGNNFLYRWDVDAVLYTPNAARPQVGTYAYKLRFSLGANEYWLGTEGGGTGGDFRTINVTQ